ncbi:MAG: helix-turn-helix domain-containing protein [Eubacterium sp.]|nr:helix-turn-helix domain-containing protein [Eubacterium sp.]
MQNYYFKLPDKIFSEGFTPIEFVVYSFLNRVKNKQGQSYYSVPNIAKNCNIGETSCRKALTSLRDNGYIDISKRYSDNVQLSNLYTVNKL